MRTTQITHQDATTSRLTNAYREGRVLHEDHAVKTLIIESHFNDNEESDHDDGLVHSHRWANQAA
jgi:hypothetical protein